MKVDPGEALQEILLDRSYRLAAPEQQLQFWRTCKRIWSDAYRPPPAPEARVPPETRLPPVDFAPTEDHVRLAAELHVNLDSELRRFHAYSFRPGPAGWDWDSLLKNWLVRAGSYRKKLVDRSEAAAEEYLARRHLEPTVAPALGGLVRVK